MLQAEALIDSLPEEVLAALDSIDAASLSSPADRALYALLLTKARDKNYIFDKNDSLITSAVDFFSSAGDDRRLMQALFYLGQVKFNADSLVSAMTSLLASLDIAAARSDYFMQGKCHELIGLMYFFHTNSDKATSHSRQAADYYTKAGKELFVIYSQFRAAVGLANSKRFNESLALLDSLAPLVQDKDDYTKAVFYAFNLRPLYDSGRGKAALDTLRKIQALYAEPLEGVYDYYDIARVFLSVGQLDSAEFYIEKYQATPNYLFSDVKMNALRRRLAAKKGDYKNAYHSALEEMISSNRKDANDYKNALAFAERDYYVDKEHSAREKAIERGQIILFIIAIAGIIASVGVVAFFSWRRRKIHRMDELMGEARRYFDRSEELSNVLGTREQELSGVKQELDDLYRSRFDSLNQLSKIYFERRSADEQDKLLKNIDYQVKGLNTPRFRENVRRTVNSLYGDIVETLKKSVERVTEREELLFALIVASLSPEAICLILGLSKSNFYTMRYRLQNKIAASGSPDKDRLLDAMKLS